MAVEKLLEEGVLEAGSDKLVVKENFLRSLFLDSESCAYFCTSVGDLRMMKENLIKMWC